MVIWEYTLDVRDIWRDHTRAFEDCRDEVVSRIRNSPFWRDAARGLLTTGGSDLIEVIVTNLEGAEDYDEFNMAWDEFYDVADNIGIWVKTV